MNINTRKLTLDDYEPMKDVMIKSYNNIGGQYWRKERIEKLLQIFPEGQFCVEADGHVVGVALSIIVNYAEFGEQHTYDQVTGNYSFNTHDPAGDMLYGIEVVVHPESRGLRIGRRLYNARKQCCEHFNLRSIMAGGRIPSYHLYADQMTPRAYLDLVTRNKLYDPTLSFQLANDFHVKRILKHYLKGDTESKEYATLLEWNNVLYNPEQSIVSLPKHIYTYEKSNDKPNIDSRRSGSCLPRHYKSGRRHEPATQSRHQAVVCH